MVRGPLQTVADEGLLGVLLDGLEEVALRPPEGHPQDHRACPLLGEVPVSYTHLDVYKRQSLFFAGRPDESLRLLDMTQEASANLSICLLYTSRCV